MSEDEREKTLRDIYEEIDDDKKKKMEHLAVGLLNVQMLVEEERALTETALTETALAKKRKKESLKEGD